jgi:monoamine oxidase
MRSHSIALDRFLHTVQRALNPPNESEISRRDLLKAAAPALLGAAALPGAMSSLNVGIVGAGLAGLTCAYELRKAGIQAAVYEAAQRPGGRCYSMGGQFSGPVNFPGQVVERGGEFIDTLHKTMLGYAKEFRLTLEDVSKSPGEVFYYFAGAAVPESKVVEEFRAFVPAMRTDLRTLSAAPTADNHTPDDVKLDVISLGEYLHTRGAGRVIREVIEQAYIAEYGRSLDDQSCLNFLLFIHADRRSKFTPFGVYSDERYHILEGNEAIARGIASRVSPQIQYGRTLVAAHKLPAGRIRLSFGGGVTADHDAVVFTIPFTVLRQVDLKELGLPPWKMEAIRRLGYGDNAKMMVGFDGPYWRALGSTGASYSDLPNHQATWETNPARATNQHAVLTDYSGAFRGKDLASVPLTSAVGAFVGDLERVFPGASQRVTRVGGNYLAKLEHWPSNPLTRGSYTCYLPGQFTSIGGNEGKPVDNIFFAGEHTDSFFEWQGFMEGALRSGIQAATAILAKK